MQVDVEKVEECKPKKLTTSRRSSRSNYWNAISYTSNSEVVKVHKVLVAEDVYTPESETSEFYVSVLLNRATGRNMIMYSTKEWILK
jgi:succinyl-CoA synthetase beta subunit